MGIGELVRLPLHRLDHARMLMAQTRDGGTAGSIEHAMAAVGDEPDALAADRHRRRGAETAMHDAGGGGAHEGQPFSVTYCEVSARRASVSSSRRFAPGPPSMKVAAASDCAIAIAPVRLGKKPGELAASNCSR